MKLGKGWIIIEEHFHTQESFLSKKYKITINLEEILKKLLKSLGQCR
jgi:hypothetical protein